MATLPEPKELGPDNSRPLQVLCLKCSRSDADLFHAVMTEGGIDCEMVPVQTRGDEIAALVQGNVDVILAGHPVPSIDGSSALDFTREHCPNVPFIVVSGTAGEEVAVETIRSGATDYVLKHRLERLVPAVRRAVRETEERRERARTEETPQSSEQQFRMLVERVPAATYIQQTVEPGKSETRPTVYASPHIEALSGFPPQDFVEDPELWIRLLHPEDRERVLSEDRRTDESGEPFRVEYRQITRDGHLLWIRDEAVLVRSEEGEPRFWQGVMYDVTDRKRAVEALKESERRFRAIFEQASVGIAQVDLEGSWLRVNDKLCEIIGYSREEIMRVDFRDILVPEDLTRDLERQVQMLEGEYRHYSEEKRIRRKDGSLRWIYLTVTLIYSSGEPESFVGVAQDITERKRVEEELGESEERFRATFEQAAVGVAHVASDGRLLRVNQRFCDIVGYTREGLLKLTFQDITHPDDLEAYLAQTRRLLAGEIETYSMEKRYIKKDGSAVWSNLTVSLVREPSGKPSYFIAVVEDITERKQVQEALRRSGELYRTVVEQAAENIYLVDLESMRVLEANAALSRSLGYTAEELKQMSLYDICAHDRESTDLNVRRVTAEGRRFIGEQRYRRKDGTLADVEVSMSLVPYGHRQAMCIVAHDITERKRAEEALEESHTLLRSIIEVTPDPIFLKDARGRYVLANSAVCENLGKSAEEILGKDNSEFMPPDAAKRIMEVDRRVMESGESLTGEERLVVQGVPKTFLFTKTPYRNLQGEVAGVIGIAHDITERKLVEERLRQSLSVLLALRQAGQILSSTLSSKEIVSRLLEVMRSVSNLTAAVISLADEQGNLRVWHSAGLDNMWERARFAPEAKEARQAALGDDEQRLFRLSQPRPDGVPTVGLCLPLGIKNQVFGVLEAYGPESLADNDTVEILSSLSSQAASALENARLYEEAEEREGVLQELVGKLLRAQEEERHRVAYEVHDGLAQVAVAAHQHLQAFARRYASGADSSQKDLERILMLVRATVSDARRIIADLRPTTLDDLGLAATISLEVESLREDGYAVTYTENLGDKRLPDSVEIALFRVVQEALRNVRKHANTRQVSIALEHRGSELHLEVRDYGRGLDPTLMSTESGPGERVGLAGMRERVGILGGNFEISSRPGAGTSIAVTVPLTH